MAKVPPMQFRVHVSRYVASLFVLVTSIGASIRLFRHPVPASLVWAGLAAMAIAIVLLGYRVLRPALRVSFDDTGLTLWSHGFGHVPWRDIAGVRWSRTCLVIDRIQSVRERASLSSVQQRMAAAVGAADLAIPVLGLDARGEQIAACIELAWRHATAQPPSQPSTNPSASSGAAT